MLPEYRPIVEDLYAIKDQLDAGEFDFVQRLIDNRPACLGFTQQIYLRRIWLRHHHTGEIEPPWDDGAAKGNCCALKKEETPGPEYEARVEKHHQAFQKIIAELKGK